MEFAGHKKIKEFTIDGQIYDEADVMRLKEKYNSIMDHYLRSQGYVPHLDLDIVFTIDYNGNWFDFKITMYGIYLGKAKAKCYMGITGSKLIPMTPMTQNKSEKSSHRVESQ